MNNYPAQTAELYVSPHGRDTWSGALPEPNSEGTDGPLATVKGAQERIRNLKYTPRHLATPHTTAGVSGPVLVWLRGGRYPISEPIVFTPEDSAPVTYAAYPGEEPVIDGGVRVTGWRTEELNGRRVWITDLPEVAAGTWSFRQLFVNGERRRRPRLPRKGLYRMDDVPGMPLPAGWGGGGYTQFVAAEGDVTPFRNLGDVEVVYVHFWIEERSPITAFDPDTRTVTMARPSRSNLVGSHGTQLADYYLDNVFEALSEPGEWYLERSTGRLYYVPKPGEDPETTEVHAPRVLQFLRIVGEPRAGRFVDFVRFQGITFQHSDWRHPGEDEGSGADLLSNASVAGNRRGAFAACAQAAADVPGVITLEGARFCGIEDCTVRNAGWYGVYIASGCEGVRVVGNDMVDLGAGGVKINGAAAGEPACLRTHNNRITDNHIHEAGRVFHSGVGVLAMHAYGNVISHNHIHDLYYSGISCGWVWGYAENVSRDNLIEKNHIHHIGQGLLSDMGGVYLLGVQPGTVVRGNLIHDVEKAHYGGWALYTDEGSSHVVLEDNVCFSTNGDIFHQHYGRENTFRNNILAFAGDAMVAYTRIEPHVGFTFTRNIVLSASAAMFKHEFGPGGRRILSDLNLYWTTTGEPPTMDQGGDPDGSLDIESWRALGHDLNSLVADPQFADVPARDFGIAVTSPAHRLGFRPIDVSDVGPRPRERRQ